ncbi:MAG: acyl-CoA dehydrogenase family protein, partial [Bacilli bacterium]
MILEQTKEMAAFHRLLQDFVANEVKPFAQEIDEEERFPLAAAKKMGEIGLYGIPFPKEYGGAGGTTEMYALAVSEIAKACATTSVVLSAHVSLCEAPIFEFGTKEQKEKYLPKLITGEWLGAFGLTEPNAGTDASGQQTMAYLDGEEYVLNGSKIFITNAGYADVYIIFAMTDKSQGVKGISAFIVEATTPGFSVGKKEKKMGIRGSSTCELIFENCRIPKANLLGAEGKGFGIA